jgi:GNAT superfamily N-acetyltransferase
MYIREAVLKDNEELQKLQSQCPMGTKMVVSTVNTPDFFARAKAYPWATVFCACDTSIVGSAAVAVRDAFIRKRITRIGYEFQYFTAPHYRRKGVAARLHQHIATYLTEHNAALSYVIIMGGNTPSQHFFESQGFSLYRTLTVSNILVYKRMETENVRTITKKDLFAVAEILNNTWQHYNLYTPVSPEQVATFMTHTPGYTCDNVAVLEDTTITACMGAWDWSTISQITLKKLPLQYQIMGLAINAVRRILPMPRVLKPGELLNQWCLTPIGVTTPEQATALLKFMNNKALDNGIKQIFCVCGENKALLKGIKQFYRTDFLVHLYVKPFQRITLGDNPVFLDGIDL